MKKIIMLFIVLSLLVFGGCSTNKSTKIIEPEHLISKEEAEKLTGKKIVEVEKTDEERVGLKICGYLTEGDELNRIFLQITIIQEAFMPKDRPSSPKEIFKGTIDAFDDKILVENIGDEAYIFTPGLHIISDDYYITVSAVAGKLDKSKTQELILETGKLAIENFNKLK